MDTPLARFFYDAYRQSGLTLDAVARRAKVSTATVGHYVQGTRGTGRQRRTVRTIRAIADALDVDGGEAVRLAQVQPRSGIEQAILDDRTLSTADRKMLLNVLHRLSAE